MTDAIEEAVKAILMRSVGEALDSEVEYGVRQVQDAVDVRDAQLSVLKEENARLKEAMTDMTLAREIAVELDRQHLLMPPRASLHVDWSERITEAEAVISARLEPKLAALKEERDALRRELDQARRRG